jgi:hypothetical protein
MYPEPIVRTGPHLAYCFALADFLRAAFPSHFLTPLTPHLQLDCEKSGLERLTSQLDANEIRDAIGLHRPWKAATTEPWLMVPSKDLSRATALSGNGHGVVTPFRVRTAYGKYLGRA